MKIKNFSLIEFTKTTPLKRMFKTKQPKALSKTVFKVKMVLFLLKDRRVQARLTQ